MNPPENIVSTTVTLEKNAELINDLSSIERVDTTILIGDASTLPLSSINHSYSTGRRLVLTTSSLDENQKVNHQIISFSFHKISF